MTYKLSPSSLNLYKDCPRCFHQQQVGGIARPSGPFPSLPSGMDAVLKRHFDAHRDAGTLPTELSGFAGDAHLFADKELLRVWRDNRRGIRWTNEAGHTLYGAVDNILQHEDGSLLVLDYKTRGFPLKEDTAAHYQNQMDLYNLLLRKNGYRTADETLLLFYYPDTLVADATVRFHVDLVRLPVDVNRAQSLFDNAIATLDGPCPHASKGCAFCAYTTKITASPASKAR